MKARIKTKIKKPEKKKPHPMITEKSYLQKRFPYFNFECGWTKEYFMEYPMKKNPMMIISRRGLYGKNIIKIRKKPDEYVITIWDEGFKGIAEEIKGLLEGCEFK